MDDFTEWKTNPLDCIFVLPSKRAGFFLRNFMHDKSDQTMIAPEIWSIEKFVENISGLQYASNTKLLFSLYEAYQEQKDLEKESFYDFNKWGQMLLQDFNEIDRHLLPEKEFFDYLGSIQEIKNWTLDGTTTPLIDKRIRFWKSLESIYQRFRVTLEAENLGYQGQIYRKAVALVPDYLGRTEGKTHVFIGFNALTRAEEEIITRILSGGKAEIFWDTDPYYLDNPVHDAGLFIRKYLRTWQYLKDSDLKGISDSFNKTKKISITGLPKMVSQAKYCGELIRRIQAEKPGGLENTALVLGDESLLNAVLHSLPSDISTVNVTMGYPVKDSALAHLFDLLFEMYSGRTKSGLKVAQLLKVLSHPFLQNWFSQLDFNVSGVTAALVRDNTFILGSKEIENLVIPPVVRELLFEVPPSPPVELITRFTALIETLEPLFITKNDQVSLEYLQHFHALFNQIADMCRQYPFINEIKALKLLYEQLLEENRIDFQGEPLEGLQIMGMLESRNLDFKTVIISSVNEGILPSGKSNNSFIPFDVKLKFGLPTYKEKDAVYTYHFYRLLQRAQSVYICYNTEPDVLEGGEPSRFIHQLINDALLSPYVTPALAAPPVGTLPEDNARIKKSESLLSLLGKKGSNGLSPTSLSLFISNPMDFYRKTILGIRDTEELEETVAANTFGTVVHETLESLYRPWVGDILSEPIIQKMKQAAPEEVNKAFQKHYLKGREAKGKNLIALEVMTKYLELFLNLEQGRVRRHQVRILGVETRLSRVLKIASPDAQILLKGTVDRIEEVDGQLRIIDYKTGRVETRDLRIREWEEIRLNPEKSKAFQVLCYAWLIQGHMLLPPEGFRAGVLSFKRLSSGFQWFEIHDSGKKYKETITGDQLDSFESQLQLLVEAIFNPDIPFALPETA